MALTVGVDTWVTLAEANAYFAAKWNATEWTDGTIIDADKEKLLKNAFNWIRQQSGFSIAATETAEIVKQAQCEAAWYIYKYWDSHEKHAAQDAQGVESFKIMNFSEKLKGVQFPPSISDMLLDYVDNEGGYFPEVERELDNNNG